MCDRINHCSNGEDEERDGESQCNPTKEGKLGLIRLLEHPENIRAIVAFD